MLIDAFHGLKHVRRVPQLSPFRANRRAAGATDGERLPLRFETLHPPFLVLMR